jgi:hypothetical protein
MGASGDSCSLHDLILAAVSFNVTGIVRSSISSTKSSSCKHSPRGPPDILRHVEHASCAWSRSSRQPAVLRRMRSPPKVHERLVRVNSERVVNPRLNVHPLQRLPIRPGLLSCSRCGTQLLATRSCVCLRIPLLATRSNRWPLFVLALPVLLTWPRVLCQTSLTSLHF